MRAKSTLSIQIQYAIQINDAFHVRSRNTTKCSRIYVIIAHHYNFFMCFTSSFWPQPTNRIQNSSDPTSMNNNSKRIHLNRIKNHLQVYYSLQIDFVMCWNVCICRFVLYKRYIYTVHCRIGFRHCFFLLLAQKRNRKKILQWIINVCALRMQQLITIETAGSFCVFVYNDLSPKG